MFVLYCCRCRCRRRRLRLVWFSSLFASLGGAWCVRIASRLRVVSGVRSRLGLHISAFHGVRFQTRARNVCISNASSASRAHSIDGARSLARSLSIHRKTWLSCVRLHTGRRSGPAIHASDNHCLMSRDACVLVRICICICVRVYVSGSGWSRRSESRVAFLSSGAWRS